MQGRQRERAQALQSQVDMLVGDIYGERDYTAIGLSATTIASSFGKVVAQDRDLDEYDPADIAMALCRMVRLAPLAPCAEDHQASNMGTDTLAQHPP